MMRLVDDAIRTLGRGNPNIPPIMVALGVLGLGRLGRTAGLVIGGVWLLEYLRERDDAQRGAGNAESPVRKSKKEADKLVDTSSEDSFPASDPPSYSSTTAGNA